MTVPLLLLGRASSALLRLASKTANGSLLFTECVLGVRPPLATPKRTSAGAASAEQLIFAPDPLALDAPCKVTSPRGSGEGQGRPCCQGIRQGSVLYPIKFGWQVGTPPRIS